MGLTHDRIPETAPPASEQELAAPAPARPNLGAAAYPVAPGDGEAAACAVLSVDPLAGYYYEALVQDPVAHTREALFTGYLHDYPSFQRMLGLVVQAGQAELERTGDPWRRGQLVGLRAGQAIGQLALRREATPFELDILLGALEPTTAPRTAAFITEVYGEAAPRLAAQLRERAADAEQRERAHALFGLLGLREEPKDERSWWDRGVDWVADGAGELTDWSVDGLSGVPALGAMAAGLAPVAKFGQGFTAGVAKGGGAMVGGLVDLSLHPLDAAMGMATMAEHVPMSPFKGLHKLYDVAAGNRSLEETFLRNPLTAGREDLSEDWAFFKQLGGAMAAPYRESVAQGKIGEAIGRGAFDVGSLFIGAGELRALGKGAEFANKLDDAAQMSTKLERPAGVADDAARVGVKPAKNPAKGADARRIPPEKGTKDALSGATKAGIQRLTPEVEAEFHRILGEARTTRLLANYGADALAHYGTEFFIKLRGVTDETMKHLLSPSRISKGEIAGCHDEADFLDLLDRQGNGAVVSMAPSPNPNVVEYRYKLYARDPTGRVVEPKILQSGKPALKTVLRDLAANPAAWRARFVRMLNEAIAQRLVPRAGGKFSVPSAGVEWVGYLRDGELKTIYSVL